MRKRRPCLRFVLLPAICLVTPVTAQGTGAVASAELRPFSAYPTGGGGSDHGSALTRGAGGAARLKLTTPAGWGVHVGYQRVRFGCDKCDQVELDSHILSAGWETGVHLTLLRRSRINLWADAGALRETLSFSAGDDVLKSRPSTGLNVAAGIETGTGRFRLLPAVRHQAASASFELAELPSRTLHATRRSIELALSMRI